MDVVVRPHDPHSLAADLTDPCDLSVFGVAPQPLYDFLPCRWPDASRSTSHLPRPFVALLILHDPKSLTAILVDPSYRTGMEALTSSLDRIQRAASQILRAIEAGG